MEVIFVDYPDGGGGEFLSYVVSLHNGFYQSSFTQEHGRHNYGASIINYLNNEARIIKKQSWSNDVLNVLGLLKLKLEQANIKKVCIPFHCFYNKDYINLKTIFPDSKVISIRPNHPKSFDLIKLELIRKVGLIKFNLKEVQFYYKFFPNQIKDPKKFIGLDVLLLTHNIEITSNNRNVMLKNLLERPIPDWDVCDYIISWDNFFLNLENLESEYLKLCDFLNLTLDSKILEIVRKRNTKNLQDLKSYNLIQECEKFGIII